MEGVSPKTEYKERTGYHVHSIVSVDYGGCGKQTFARDQKESSGHPCAWLFGQHFGLRQQGQSERSRPAAISSLPSVTAGKNGRENLVKTVMSGLCGSGRFPGARSLTLPAGPFKTRQIETRRPLFLPSSLGRWMKSGRKKVGKFQTQSIASRMLHSGSLR
jgi:hypothetical protein